MAALLAERVCADPKAQKEWTGKVDVKGSPEALAFWASLGVG